MTLDPCSLPLDEGSCTAYTLRWYHRAVPGGTACHPFVYGGCGGNANRFGTREACERRCPPQVVHSQRTGRGLDSLNEGCTYLYKCLGKKLPETGGPGADATSKNWLISPAVEPAWSLSVFLFTKGPSLSRSTHPIPQGCFCRVSVPTLCWERK